MSRVTRSAATGSSRLDAAVAILALASPFVLPVLFVAWLHPAGVVTPGSAAVATPGAVAAASVTPGEPQTQTATATSQPRGAASGGAESPTPAPHDSPGTAAAPAPATAVPATSAPASASSPALGPTLTQPPTATIAGAADVVAEPSPVTGLLLLGGLGVVFLTMGRRPTRGRPNYGG